MANYKVTEHQSSKFVASFCIAVLQFLFVYFNRLSVFALNHTAVKPERYTNSYIYSWNLNYIFVDWTRN